MAAEIGRSVAKAGSVIRGWRDVRPVIGCDFSNAKSVNIVKSVATALRRLDPIGGETVGVDRVEEGLIEVVDQLLSSSDFVGAKLLTDQPSVDQRLHHLIE